MFPQTSDADGAYCRGRHVEFFCKSYACLFGRKNVANLFFSQNCVSVIRTSFYRFWVFATRMRLTSHNRRINVPPFASRISYVVELRSNKQMFRPTALWIVAFVQYIQSLWNWAYECFVRKTMGFCVVSSPMNNLAVLAVRGRSLPTPTSFGMLDDMAFIIASDRAKFIASEAFKRAAANRTRLFHWSIRT